MASNVYIQRTHRWIDDDGNESGSTLLGSNGDDRSVNVGTIIRLRFVIEETANSKTETIYPEIQQNYEGGGWEVMDTSTTEAIVLTSSYVSDGTATTQRLGYTSGGPTWIAGFICDDNDNAHSVSLRYNYTEVEFVIQVQSSLVSNDDQIQFRVYNNGTALNTYDDTPILTVIKAASDNLTASEMTLGAWTMDSPTVASYATLSADEMTLGAWTLDSPTSDAVGISIEGETYGNSGGGSGPTTSSSIDTTGADFLLVAVAYYAQGTLPTVSDSKTNTWQALTAYDNAGTSNVRLFYSYNPTVGTGHTFTVTHPSTPFMTYFVYALSGMDTTSSVFDTQNGAGTSGSAYSSGYITPDESGELIVSLYCVYSEGTTAPSPSSPFILRGWDPYNGGVTPGGAFAWVNTYDSTTQIQATWDVGDGSAVTIAAFTLASNTVNLTADEMTLGAWTLDTPTLSEVGTYALVSWLEMQLPAAEGTDALTASEMTLGAWTLDSPTLTSTADLSASEMTLGAWTLDTPTLTSIADLSASEMTADAWTLDSPTLTSTAGLSAQELTGDAWTLDSPTLTSTADLDASEMTLGAWTLDSPTLDSTADLDATELTNSAWTLDQPTLAAVPTLTASELTNGAWTLDQSTLAAVPTLTANELTNGAWVLDQPTISSEGEDTLTADEMTLGAWTMDTPTIVGIVDLTSSELTNSAWTLDQPTVTSTADLTANEITNPAWVLDQPTLDSTADLTASELTNSAWTLDSPTLDSTADLTSDEITNGAWVLDTPTLAPVGSLSAQELTADGWTLDGPTLATIGELTASELTNGGWVIDAPQIEESQFMRPNNDDSAGNWQSTEATLYEAIDEVTPNHSDYIYSDNDPTSSQVEIGLTNIADPQSSGMHIVRYWIAATGPGTASMTFYVMQGVTQIATWTENNIPGTPTEGSYELTGVEKSNVTDYSALSIIAEANVT